MTSMQIVTLILELFDYVVMIVSLLSFMYKYIQETHLYIENQTLFL